MIRLENAALRLDCLPAIGARIVALVDRTTGRDWLTTGRPPVDPTIWAGDDAVFGGDQAFGWDECLPTIARCPDPLDPTGPALRDHGDAWGRPTAVERRGDDTLVARDGSATSRTAESRAASTSRSNRAPPTLRESLR